MHYFGSSFTHYEQPRHRKFSGVESILTNPIRIVEHHCTIQIHSTPNKGLVVVNGYVHLGCWAAAVLDWFMKDVILACKKCPELAQVSSFCPFVRKSRASPKTPYRPERRAKGPPETQRFKAPAMHTGAETHLASQTREHTPCTQTIDGLLYYLYTVSVIFVV